MPDFQNKSPGILDEIVKKKQQENSKQVPVPPKFKGKWSCITRIQDLNRSSGECPVFGWGWGLNKDFQTAKNEAVQMANKSVKAVDTHHAQWRGINSKGDIKWHYLIEMIMSYCRRSTT